MRKNCLSRPRDSFDSKLKLNHSQMNMENCNNQVGKENSFLRRQVGRLEARVKQLVAERSADHRRICAWCGAFSTIVHTNQQKKGGSRETFNKLDGESERWGGGKGREGVDRGEEEDTPYFDSGIGLESTSSSVSGIVSASVRDFAAASAVAAGSAATAESMIKKVTFGADLGDN